MHDQIIFVGYADRHTGPGKLENRVTKMFWPRLQLTAKEAERWAPYYDPEKLQRAVIYRTYNGEINLNNITKEDTENLQISRRSRVFAFTASGDIHNTEIQIYDSGGEQYTMGFVPITNLLLGNNPDPRGMATFNEAMQAQLSMWRLAFGAVMGMAFTMAPHIFEPNIVLDPNQTISIKGRNMKTIQTVSTPFGDQPPASHVSFNIHVWEFPVE